MEIQIAPIAGNEIDEAIAVLTCAFMPDPIFSYFFPRPLDRAGVFAACFRAAVVVHRRFGHVYVAKHAGVVVGTAVWRSPDAGEPSAEDMALEHRAAEAVAAIDPAAAAGLLGGFKTIAAQHPAQPHWYLFFVGLDPALQGRGIGRRLLAPVLDAADASATPCYLETPFARTHAFYRGLGFDIASEGHPFVDAPTVWTMLRQPRRSEVR